MIDSSLIFFFVRSQFVNLKVTYIIQDLWNILSVMNFFRDLWIPDASFFHQVSSSEVKALHLNISKQKFVASKVASGKIFLEFSERLKVSVKCDMDFTAYPFDTQNCPFLILSLRNQKIKWIIKGDVKFSNLIHPDFQIVGKMFENSSITEDKTNI